MSNVQDNTKPERIRVFPLNVVNNLIILGLSLFVSLLIYTNTIGWLHKRYYDVFSTVNVVCPMLADYGDSDHYGCNKDSSSKNTASAVLSPNDLLSIMSAAGIEKKKDYEKTKDFLNLKRSGPGAWLATKILSTSLTKEELSLQEFFLNGHTFSSINKDTHPDLKAGSLYALLKLSQVIGLSSNTTLSDSYSGISKLVEVGTDELALDLTGYTRISSKTGSGSFLGIDTRYLPLLSGSKKSKSDAIKHAIKYRFDTTKIFEDPLIYSIKPGSKLTSQVYADEKYTAKDEVLMKNTRWYKNDPKLIDKALFSFSNLIINEINRHPDVKLKRYAYLSFRGVIQFTILTLGVYILILLIWRFIANLVSHKKDTIHPLKPHIPVLTVGNTDELTNEIDDSRVYIDHLISTLPLIGLFGTVVGILMGLPNAAAAITKTGPGASEAVNELFTQLGLAFSTTAMAVFAVVILELLWIVLQSLEDHKLWKASQKNDMKPENGPLTGIEEKTSPAVIREE